VKKLEVSSFEEGELKKAEQTNVWVMSRQFKTS
jgi:hypothetical protein